MFRFCKRALLAPCTLFLAAALAACNGGGPIQTILVHASPGPAASPSSLAITTLGASGAQTFTASETGYAGTLNATSSSPSVATVSPASGPSGTTFTVTGVSGGTVDIVITDSSNNATDVPLSVTSGAFQVQSKGASK